MTRALILGLLLVSFPAWTQPIVEIQHRLTAIERDVARLKEQADLEAEANASQARVLAEILSRQVAQFAPSKASASTWVAGADSARQQLTDEAGRAAFLEGLPANVRQLAKACVTAAASAQVTTQDSPNFELSGCSKEQREELSAGLDKAGRDAMAVYRKCEAVVEDLAPEYRALVPANPHDFRSTNDVVNALGQHPAPAVADCAVSLANAAKSLAAEKDARKILANAFTMAANICFASGGNPWVCGGMFAIAVLMEIFDGSGGGGGGDGPGEGPDNGGVDEGKGTVPVVSSGPRSETPSESAARNAQVREATGPRRAANMPNMLTSANSDGNIGSVTADSNIRCNGVANQVKCDVVGKADSAVIFRGDPLIAQLAQRRETGASVVCTVRETASIQTIKGLAIKTNGRWAIFGASSTGASRSIPGLHGTAEEACAKLQ